MENKIWLGASIHSGDRAFFVPDDYPLEAAGCGVDKETGRKFIRVKGVRWFTNLDIKQRHEEMILVNHYKTDLYPQFDNYGAINVGKTTDIPCNYPGVMGVPITFLDKYNPDQFEIVGELNHGCDNKYDLGKPIINGIEKYPRVLIRNKHPEKREGEQGF